MIDVNAAGETPGSMSIAVSVSPLELNMPPGFTEKRAIAAEADTCPADVSGDGSSISPANVTAGDVSVLIATMFAG